jgi:hypothetical protein
MPSEPRSTDRLLDVDALLASLRTPPAPRPAPAWEAAATQRSEQPGTDPEHHRPWARRAGIGAGLALAAAVLISLTGRPSDEPGFRGGATPVSTVEVDLRLVVHDGASTQRLGSHETIERGTQVFFRVGSTPAAELRVWVDGPSGREEITVLTAEPTPVDLHSAHGLLAYVPTAPGHYHFVASTNPGGPCQAPGCASVELVVR